MINKMKKWIIDYIQSIQITGRRKRVDLQTIENYLIYDRFKDAIRYHEVDGYRSLAQIFNELIEEGLIAPVKNSPLNGRKPSLHIQWWILPASVQQKWSDMQILTVADLLNLTRYRQRPEWQSDQDWQRIEAIYTFLKEKNKNHWVTREERAFQLFGEEKFFSSSEGMVLMQRLGLSLEDLKAKVYGEPFVFWSSPQCEIKNAKTVLIVENLSFYHTCRQLMMKGETIIDIDPDLLIYGEGKKIEKSIAFLNDITNAEDLTIYYVGDIDPEGWGIYVRLKDAYYVYNIKLAISIYQALLAKQKLNKTEKQQNENAKYLDRVMEEFEQQGFLKEAKIIKELWEQKLRVPQEALSLDTINQ